MKTLVVLVIFLALAAGVTLWRAAQSEAAARASHPPLGRFVEVGGHRVHYVQQGSGPDVVLIHGASGNLRDFTFDLVGRLTDRYRVTVFDRPGLGYSDRLGPGGASISEQARQLAAASTALGVEAPLVLGHSYGGAVALAWAVHADDMPVAPSALVLLAAASHPWNTPLGTYYEVLSHPVAGPVMATILSAWVPERVVEDAVDSIFAPQDTPEGYHDYIGTGLTLQRSVLLENANQRAALLDEIEALAPAYPDLTLPIEVLHGDRDTTVGLAIHSEPLARRVDSATLTPLPGVGHAPHHADPAATVAAIDRAATRAGLR